MTDTDFHILPANHADVAALAQATKKFLEDGSNKTQLNLVDLRMRLSG
jgi:hypothetical protein